MLKKQITYKIIHAFVITLLIGFWILGIILFDDNVAYNMFLLTVMLFFTALPFLMFIISIIKEVNIKEYEINKVFLLSFMGIMLYSTLVYVLVRQVVGESVDDSLLTIIEYQDFSTVLPIFISLVIFGNISVFVIAKRLAVKQIENENSVEKRFIKNK